jgi:ParB-like nuclease domain
VADPVGAVSFPGAPPCLEDVAIERLRPDPANPRQIDEDELEALTRSIRHYGFVQPIVATRDGTVVAGHQRLIAARRLGSRPSQSSSLTCRPPRRALSGLPSTRSAAAGMSSSSPT